MAEVLTPFELTIGLFIKAKYPRNTRACPSIINIRFTLSIRTRMWEFRINGHYRDRWVK
jgi:hypothetical protein